jgi:hypothetical protein
MFEHSEQAFIHNRGCRGDSNQIGNIAREITWRTTKANEWPPFAMTIKESGWILPRSSAIFHAKASWAVRVWHDTIPSEQPYNEVSYHPTQRPSSYLASGGLLPICASTQVKCLFQGAQPTLSLVDTGGGYHHWSSKFMIHHSLTLPIQYSALFPNCPAWSQTIQQNPLIA